MKVVDGGGTLALAVLLVVAITLGLAKVAPFVKALAKDVEVLKERTPLTLAEDVAILKERTRGLRVVKRDARTMTVTIDPPLDDDDK